MNLRTLRYFAAAAEFANLTRAAEHLSVSQPTLTTALNRLEAELGTKLLHRAPRQTELTPDGQKFLIRARRILNEYTQAKDDFRGRTERGEGVLRIGVLATLPSVHLPALVRTLENTMPKSALLVREGAPSQLLKWLDQGRVDMTLSTHRPRRETFESQLLYQEPFVAIAPIGHAYAKRAALTAGDFHGQPFVLREHCEDARRGARIFAEHGVKPRIVARVLHDDHAMALVADGIGLSLVPAGGLPGTVVAVPVPELGIGRDIALAWRKETPAAVVEAAAAAARKVAGRPRA